MKASDRSVLFGLVIVGLLAAFWFLLLSPKRDRAAELETQVSDLQAEVTAQEQLAVAAEQAQADYGKNYERLVVLGEAAPADGDTPSLLAELSTQAKRSGTEFGSLTLNSEGGQEATTATAQTTTDQNAEAGQSTAGAGDPAATTTAPAPATEASASLLPLGASVGPAGLAVMPYSLSFAGDFFEIADLLKSLDAQVGTGERTKVDGRLLTVDGFSLTPDQSGDLMADLEITTYLLPDSQGLTAGATPAAPPAAVPPATPTPTSTAPMP